MKINWKIEYAKGCILLLFAIITMLQIFSFPGQFRHMRTQGDINLLHEIALTILFAVILFTAQITLYLLWRILGLIKKDEFYTFATLKFLNQIVGILRISLICAVILLVLILLQADDPGGPVLLTAVTLFISTLYIFASLLRDQIKVKVA